MTSIASQITSLTIVYSTVYSDADQRKKDQFKCFHLRTSSWHAVSEVATYMETVTYRRQTVDYEEQVDSTF